MDTKKGTKEIMELIAGVKEIAIAGKKVLADGKVDMADLPILMDLVQKQEVLMNAFGGLAELSGEVKDIDMDEAVQVIVALVQAAKDFKAA